MSSKKVVSLYRLLLQNARKIDQYNFRSWCIRKVINRSYNKFNVI